MLRLNRRGRNVPQGLNSSRLSYLRFLLLTALIASCAGSASAQSGELVQYPSEEIGFICGPQLKSGSASNPFPWFDKTQLEYGHALGRMTPAVAPRVLTGKVTVQQGSTFVDGVGTRFTVEVDPNGPAPLYNGWFRVKMADGTYREARVASVASDTRLVLTAAWPHASAAGAEADTNHFDATLGYWNYDRYFDSAYYDLALVQYINYYRTGDPAFLTYARRAADSWWGSPFIGHGTVDSGPNSLPPRSMAYAGLMLRALDGRPEMWDFIHRRGSFIFDHWVLKRVADRTLYYDMREDGYAQLYAVLIAKALPDSYDAYPQGTLAPAAGRVTDGAQKRADLLRDTGRTAVEFFGRLQKPDGSWRWDIIIDGTSLIATEQPFMVGIYLEAAVALHQIAQDPAVKASLRTQIEKSVRHIYTQAYRGNETVADMPQYKWRGMWYYWGGGTPQDPTLYERGQGSGDMKTNGEVWVIGGARHLNSTLHHAFGYAYAMTGNAEYLQMGDDVFDASYGERVDGIHGYANSGRGKDYAMNYRASGHYLVWRLGQTAPAPTPTPTPAPTPAPVAATVSITSPANGAQFTEPVNVTVTVDVTPGSGGVSKVEFFDGATLLGESSAKPYTFVWNNVPAGTHVLTARAADWSGQTVTSAAVTFKVARAGDSVARARRNAQVTSNQLAQSQAQSGGGGAMAPAEVTSSLSAVAADVWQAYLDFSREQTAFPAAARIEPALNSAVSYSKAAESLAQTAGNTPEVQKTLRKAIDSLMLANVLMVYGDIANPLDTPEYFVRQHYVDFLGREPDESGQDFWVGRLTPCGSDAQCMEVSRINVSAAYFHSIEFKETGFLLYRLYRATLGRAPLLAEFTPDSQELSRGVIVHATGWQERIEANKVAFLQQWVVRPEFKTRFDGMTNAQFVSALVSNAGVTISAQERDALVSALNAGTGRDVVLRRMVELESVARQQTNAAFVTMEYFGYLQRDPDAVGYAHWLGKLEEFGGNYERAEMVKAFLASIEYRQRFGRP